MSGEFHVLGSGEPDEIDVELALLGEPEALQQTRGLASLDPTRAELSRWQRWWERHRPELPGAPSARATRQQWLRAAAGSALLLAAALLMVLLVSSGAEDPGARAMGQSLPVDLAISRDSQPVGAPYALLPGDLVRVRLVAPRDGVLEVWTIQDDGAVSLLEGGREVARGETFLLDGAARLDDHAGREWLVVRLVPQARAPSSIEDEAQRLLPDPRQAISADRWVFEITRGEAH